MQGRGRQRHCMETGNHPHPEIRVVSQNPIRRFSYVKGRESPNFLKETLRLISMDCVSPSGRKAHRLKRKSRAESHFSPKHIRVLVEK